MLNFFHPTFFLFKLIFLIKKKQCPFLKPQEKNIQLSLTSPKNFLCKPSPLFVFGKYLPSFKITQLPSTNENAFNYSLVNEG
jgi:hypothetical protein